MVGGIGRCQVYWTSTIIFGLRVLERLQLEQVVNIDIQVISYKAMRKHLFMVMNTNKTNAPEFVGFNDFSVNSNAFYRSGLKSKLTL